MTTLIRENNLIVLEDGNIFLYDSYNGKTEPIGHSSEIKTWVEIVRRWGQGSTKNLQTLIRPIWNALSVPSEFEAVYKIVEGKVSLFKIAFISEEETPRVEGDVVYITTSNPFNLSPSEEEVIKSTLEAKNAERLHKKEEKARLKQEGNVELLKALRTLLEGNPTFQLVGEGDNINYYDVVSFLNGVKIYKIDAIKFISKALPELWEKYKNVY